MKKQDFGIVLGISIVLAGLTYGANIFGVRDAGIGFAALVFIMPLVSFFAVSWGVKMGLDAKNAAGVVAAASVLAYVLAGLSFGAQLLSGPAVALLAALLVPPVHRVVKTVIA